MYIFFGDGGGSGDEHGHGQNTSNAYGTILRSVHDSSCRFSVTTRVSWLEHLMHVLT